MPVPHHDPIEFTAGDDWDIAGTLPGPDGTAYDLTNATVIWMPPMVYQRCCPRSTA